MRLVLSSAGLLVLLASSIAGAAGQNIWDAPLSDTLEEVRADAGIQPRLFHYHFDVEAPPAKPESGDPARGASGQLGFTLPSVKRTSSIAWEQRPVSRRKVALYAKAVRIDYALSQRVFVSPGVAEGSCQWRAAWKHELIHASAFSKLFVESIPALKSSLESEAESIGLPSPSAPAIVKEGEASRLRETAAERLSEALERHAAALAAKMDEERARLDAPENYVRAFNACGAPVAASGPRLDQGGAKTQLLVP